MWTPGEIHIWIHMSSFNFKVKARPGSRPQLLLLCEHYNIGEVTIRTPFRRLSDGDIEYTVDVSNPTEYGIYLMGWMDRCEYDKVLQSHAVDRPILHDAWLRWGERNA